MRESLVRESAVKCVNQPVHAAAAPRVNGLSIVQFLTELDGVVPRPGAAGFSGASVPAQRPGAAQHKGKVMGNSSQPGTTLRSIDSFKLCDTSSLKQGHGLARTRVLRGGRHAAFLQPVPGHRVTQLPNVEEPCGGVDVREPRPFLINQKDVSFKVRTLLERLENDADATRSDPELMQHVRPLAPHRAACDSCCYLSA